ncbi:MAG TPA: substrate-binding domain-containing protein [Gemmataceae bacterium]|nr:substrate-binding domain-containing protein [Gemmataceae bacterium]
MRAKLIVSALLGLAALTGCGTSTNRTTNSGQASTGERRIIIMTNGNSPFWDACRVGLQEAEKNLGLNKAGFRAILEVNDGTPQGQIDKLRQFASQSDIVALGISPCDAANLAVAELMRDLKKRGVHVVTIDSDMDRETLRDTRFAFIGTDNLAGGRELGKCAKNLRPEGGEYVTFVGRTGAQNAIDRVEGVRQGAGDKFKALDNMADETDLTRARENVRNAIRNHPKLNTLVGIWSYNAPAIADVVKEMNNRKQFTIVTFDAEPLAIRQMGEGLIDAMVVQNPYQMGYQGVRLLKALVEKDQGIVKEMFPNLGKTDGDIYDTGIKVVVPDEGSALKPEMFDKKTEFLKLSDFQRWLKKYDLTGS